MTSYPARVRGCLLGGALGDALGNPIEFNRSPDLRDLPPGEAEITDDTQMTLFTVEGLIRASVRADRGVVHPPAVVHRAYLRWLATQELPGPPADPDGWLAAQPFLYARRAPGNACLSGLRAGRMGVPHTPANPDSKGCGAVMRSAPFGLLEHLAPEDAFGFAVECAVQTHGHPTGYLAAGAFAAMIRLLLTGANVTEAAEGAIDVLVRHRGHEETLTALRRALDTPYQSGNEGIERIGLGWIAEEALAMGVYAAINAEAVEDALLLSVNHAGDSDSTGSICGNLLGAERGEAALPRSWVERLEGLDTIEALADDLVREVTGERTREWHVRYPGS